MQTLPLSFEIATGLVRVIILLAQVHLSMWLYEFLAGRGIRRAAWASTGFLVLGLALAGSCDLIKADELLLGPQRAPYAWRLCSSAWVGGSFGAYLLLLLYRGAGWHRQRGTLQDSRNRGPRPAQGIARRQLLSTLARAGVAAPFALSGYGTFIGRQRFELREIDLSFSGLPESLDGFRIAQLTDLHCGPYLTPADVEYVVEMANETSPHLAVVTGDLITAAGDPLVPCLQALSKMRAEAGVFGCLGNHETYTRSEEFVQERGRALGMEFLRQRSAPLRIGGATLNLCGVDYQRKSRPYLARAERMVDPAAFNVLLTHNPDVFPVAAGMGYDLLVAGHTHGGQVTVEIVEQWVNAGHFFTPYVAGEYRLGRSAIYVSRGIGTVNLPMRVGALPEVTLLRLRRA